MSTIPFHKLRAAVRASDAKSDDPFLRSIGKICELEEDLEGVRAMTVEQHRAVLEAACRDAVRIEAARMERGFPVTESHPWPESTWELLKRLTANVRPQ